MKTMKNAGFDVMYFGAESGCQKVLDYYLSLIHISEPTRPY